MRLLTVAHAGAAGHRGSDATEHSLAFWWPTLRDDTRNFFSNCLRCILSKSGERVPRPPASTAHALRPNQILHFDYLYMGTGADGHRYTLVLKDDLSSY